MRLASISIDTHTRSLLSLLSQICNQGKVTQTVLDFDAISHSKRGGKPETITLGMNNPGKYVFRVAEYKGKDSSGLLNSGVRVLFSHASRTRVTISMLLHRS